MGFNFNVQGLARHPYDVSTTGGIKFWLKSSAPLSVEFLLPETTPVSDGSGTCVDTAMDWNCNNPFRIAISGPFRTAGC